MNIEQLRKQLEQLGVREDAYDLSGGHMSERLTLSLSSGKWQVYYSERGIETGKVEFLEEDSACRYLLERLQNDPTVFKK